MDSTTDTAATTTPLQSPVAAGNATPTGVTAPEETTAVVAAASAASTDVSADTMVSPRPVSPRSSSFPPGSAAAVEGVVATSPRAVPASPRKSASFVHRTSFTEEPSKYQHPLVPAELRQVYAAGEQNDVFQFVDQAGKVSDDDVKALVRDLESLDVEYIKKIYTESLLFDKAAQASLTNCSITPLDEFDSLLSAPADATAAWRVAGLDAINRGEVGAMVLAGGQGTRLGFNGPKGMFDIGLLSKKSLFQLFAERIVKLQALAKAHGHLPAEPVIPLYVMTSEMNHDTTARFFEEHNYFGLAASQVVFFPQGTLPCLTKSGHIMLETPTKVARASDGNGGVFVALRKHGVLQNMLERGLQHLHVFSVDNALTKVADPVFVGYCMAKKADIGNKVVWKTAPDEKVGVVAMKDAKYCVVEYSELDAANAVLVDQASGKLAFGAGNICNHYFHIPFLHRVLTSVELPFHIAMKNIPAVSTTAPDAATLPGMKLEAFIFDIFAYASSMAVLEVAREDEFAPVKNANGAQSSGYTADSPESAKFLLSAQAKRWIEVEGGDFSLHLITKGTALKRGQRMKRWTPRVLEFNAATNTIRAFKSDKAKAKKKAASVISCQPYNKEPNALVCALGTGKRLKLKFDSAEEQARWIALIQDALRPDVANTRLCEVSPLVSYEGEDLGHLAGRPCTLPFYLSEVTNRRLSQRSLSVGEFVSTSAMKTLQVKPSGQSAIVYEPIPVATGADVVIDTKFAAVSPLDVGGLRSPPTATFVPGHGLSGVVLAVGPDAQNVRVGDRVCAYVPTGGAFREFVTLSTDACVASVPLSMALDLASHVPTTALLATAFAAGVQAGDRVVVVANHGDIGYVLAQLAAGRGADWIGVVTHRPEAFAGLDVVAASSLAEIETACATANAGASPSCVIDVAQCVATAAAAPPQFAPAQLVDIIDAIASDTLHFPAALVVEKPFEYFLDATAESLMAEPVSVALRLTPPKLPDDLVRRLEEAKQDQVLKFYRENMLSNKEIDQLIHDLEFLDFDHLASIFKTSMASDHAPTGQLEPLDSADSLAATSEEVLESWATTGLAAIAHNQVAALVLSGGQGTRLGFAGPKGMYNIGLPSGKSLFQLFAERIVRLQQLAAAAFPDVPQTILLPLYVMTSAMNHDTTVVFFKQHAYFGLDPAQVFFFPQGTLPCFTVDGKLMLESAGKLATASDGNGGIYAALAKSGALRRMDESGVQYVHVFSVDNALCKVADPMFMGYCIQKEADCGNKVVWKARPEESVGVVAKRGGRYCVVEYSEMDKATSELRDSATNELVYGAANICNHFYTLTFLKDVVLPNMSLQYHVAHKKIPMADDSGATFTPTTNSGVKLESFIFDVFPLSRRMAVLSVPRDDEFSPVKNAPGAAVDSPDTARAMLGAQAKRWLAPHVRRPAALDALAYAEISPLVSFAGEDLNEYVAALTPTTTTLVLDTKDMPASAHCVPTALRHRLHEAGQAHVLQFVDAGRVSRFDAALLLHDLATIDFASLAASFERSMAPPSVPAALEPLTTEVDVLETAADKALWRDTGLAALKAGKVAALVLAGGQGTRLGFDGPKGLYDIGLPSGATLFELFARRLRKLELLTGGVVPFYVLTSGLNHDATVAYFERQLYFGLQPSQVVFCAQGTLPCLTTAGKLMLATPGALSRAPDGNGGVYRALRVNGALDDMQARGVEYLHVFSVDNALCKVADPMFMGYCIAKGADCGNKVVWKARPEESVGVVAKRGGRYCVVEYSEMDKATSELRDPATNELVYGAANICNHFYSMEFLMRCCADDAATAYHVAHKKIPYVDAATGVVVDKPTANTGIKLEAFIFDVFALASRMQILAASRDEEFAPVKNAPGAAVDSPDTARAMLSARAKAWVTAAGGSFASPDGLCDVDPLVSYDGEGLEHLAAAPVKLPAYITSPTASRKASAAPSRPSATAETPMARAPAAKKDKCVIM
ncbi:UDP-N-acetylhexosamine pyrophosphorylase [Achlya hypogyna]|uniref:UDP-N-acetylglucosamine diphosphorylase n=1 Tax=Achlya hypogyna TaxID=1202772 RepID=A0A1V9YQA2_ACHHY|nr:UDP-N-acetylhexosamine pyrophosphorylase [Achlya hypogyna]